MAHQILRKCINSRATYLARVAEPHREAKHLFHLFDLYINAGLTCLSGYRSRPGCENFWDVQHLVVTPYLRALPTSLGGLGLPLHGGLAGSYGCLRSRLITHSFLDRHSDSFGSLLAEKSKWSRVSLVESKDIRFWNFFATPALAQENSWFAVQTLRNSLDAIEVKFPRSFRSQRSLPSPTSYLAVTTGATNRFETLPPAAALRGRIENPSNNATADFECVRNHDNAAAAIVVQHAQDRDWLLDTLRDKLGWLDCAAWLNHSCFDKSGSIFNKIGASGYFETRIFSHAQFKDCLGLRLMLPIIPLNQDPVSDDYTCSCGAKVNLLLDRFHCLGCCAQQGSFNRRHYQICQILDGAMRTNRLPFVHPLANDTQTKEYTLPPARDAQICRADLAFIGLERIHYIVDIAVMAPTAPSYIKHQGTHLRMNAAHSHVLKQKDERYKAYITPSNNTDLTDTYSLIPFIIDCTGNLGAHTKDFFIAQNMEDYRKKPALRRIQAELSWFNAEMRKDYRSRSIPPIDVATRMRQVPTNIHPSHAKRGRPSGSLGRNSRGQAQVAAVANIETNFQTSQAPTEDSIYMGNEEEVSTGQT